MKKCTYRKAAIIMLLGIVPFSGYSQHEFSMDAEYRPRAEVRSGYSKPLSKDCSPDFLMLQRVRIGGSYQSKYINARLTIQDSRVFGGVTQQGKNLISENTGLFLYEAWAELVLPKGLSFRIGRQELNYDDERLLSKSDWSNTGNAHDLAKLMFRYKTFKADLGYAYNNNQSNPLTSDYEYSNGFYRNMLYLWLSGNLPSSGLTLSGLAVREGFQETKKVYSEEDKTKLISTAYLNHNRYTYGGNIEFRKKEFPLSGALCAYGQSGETAKGLDLSAFLLAAKLDYKIIKPLTLTVGTDWYSGTSASVDKKSETHTFMGLYGSNHRFNGAMDYWTPTSAPAGGLIDIYLQAKYKINDKVDVTGGFRTFRLQKAMFADGDKGLGHEIDLDVSYKFCKIALIKAGYSCYFCTDLTKQVRGVTLPEPAPQVYNTRFPQWAYVSICVFPKLFTYKSK